jgi:hypothetical protein
VVVKAGSSGDNGRYAVNDLKIIYPDLIGKYVFYSIFAQCLSPNLNYLTQSVGSNKRKGEGLFKGKIIREILKGNNTRQKVSNALSSEISKEDVKYHLSSSSNYGLVYQKILTEKKGILCLNRRNLKSVSEAMRYLSKLPEFKHAFSTAFAECFYSGYGESLHYLGFVKALKEEGRFDAKIVAFAP